MQAEGGQLVYVSVKMRQVVEMVWTSILRRNRVRCALVSERKPKDLDAARAFVANGTSRPRVDKGVPGLERSAEAHRYAESEVRSGPVVVTVAQRACGLADHRPWKASAGRDV